jgi:hypothetical protein
MRYQQVYSASLFTNLDPGVVYVTSLRFEGYFPSPPSAGWELASVQIDLSTTTNTLDHLSTNFAENVGIDDTVVYGPGPYNLDSGQQLLLFNKPFRFHPPLGNLLLDVRIFNGKDYTDPFNPWPQMWAFNSPTDEVSRVWATNVAATVADGADTVGLTTLIGLSTVPSLWTEFLPVYAGSESNIIHVWWPPQPTNFVLQSRDNLAGNTSWQAATNQVFGSPDPHGRGWFIELQAASAGPARFYRLVWPGGQ